MRADVVKRFTCDLNDFDLKLIAGGLRTSETADLVEKSISTLEQQYCILYC